MDNLEGKQLGNYHLIRKLGRGGFADVYLGEHKDMLGHLVAIKVLHTVNEEEIEKFRKEAQILIGLKHPHIVQVLDFGVEGNIIPYLIMPVYGKSLRGTYPR